VQIRANEDRTEKLQHNRESAKLWRTLRREYSRDASSKRTSAKSRRAARNFRDTLPMPRSESAAECTRTQLARSIHRGETRCVLIPRAGIWQIALSSGTWRTEFPAEFRLRRWRQYRSIARIRREIARTGLFRVMLENCLSKEDSKLSSKLQRTPRPTKQPNAHAGAGPDGSERENSGKECDAGKAAER